MQTIQQNLYLGKLLKFEKKNANDEAFHLQIALQILGTLEVIISVTKLPSLKMCEQ